MRLRKVNQRRKRCTRKVTEKTAVPFCYILYDGGRLGPVKDCGCGCGYVYYNDYLVHPDEVPDGEVKRPFPSYRELIAHLTRVKLNIQKEDKQWTHLRACKIVEGWYTKTGKEIVTKEYELPDERNSMQRRRDERRLLNQQRRSMFAFPEDMEGYIPGSGTAMWSSGTTTTSSTTTTMDTGWTSPQTVAHPGHFSTATSAVA